MDVITGDTCHQAGLDDNVSSSISGKDHKGEDNILQPNNNTTEGIARETPVTDAEVKSDLHKVVKCDSDNFSLIDIDTDQQVFISDYNDTVFNTSEKHNSISEIIVKTLHNNSEVIDNNPEVCAVQNVCSNLQCQSNLTDIDKKTLGTSATIVKNNNVYNLCNSSDLVCSGNDSELVRRTVQIKKVSLNKT